MLAGNRFHDCLAKSLIPSRFFRFLWRVEHRGWLAWHVSHSRRFVYLFSVSDMNPLSSSPTFSFQFSVPARHAFFFSSTTYAHPPSTVLNRSHLSRHHWTSLQLYATVIPQIETFTTAHIFSSSFRHATSCVPPPFFLPFPILHLCVFMCCTPPNVLFASRITLKA